jgi:hypothetical protein
MRPRSTREDAIGERIVAFASTAWIGTVVMPGSTFDRSQQLIEIRMVYAVAPTDACGVINV